MKFYLNGDGMVNVSPLMAYEAKTYDTLSPVADRWHITMSNSEFNTYLEENELYLDGGWILDNDDDYIFGKVLDS